MAKELRAGLFSFPAYETKYGQLIKRHLTGGWKCQAEDPVDADNLNALTLQALMLANKIEKDDEVLFYATRGDVVLDRHWPSAWVYGKSDGLDPEWLKSQHTLLVQSDLYILLDIDPTVSVERRPDRRDRYEMDDKMGMRAEFYRQLWASMDGDQDSDGSTWVSVDARGSKDQTFEQIMRHVRESRSGTH